MKCLCGAWCVCVRVVLCGAMWCVVVRGVSKLFLHYHFIILLVHLDDVDCWGGWAGWMDIFKNIDGRNPCPFVVVLGVI